MHRVHDIGMYLQTHTRARTEIQEVSQREILQKFGEEHTTNRGCFKHKIRWGDLERRVTWSEPCNSGMGTAKNNFGGYLVPFLMYAAWLLASEESSTRVFK